jgi:uncharacterized protein DUF4239
VGWIHEIPRWLAAIVVIATFSASALAGLAMTHGWIRRRGLQALIDNSVVGWMFSAILSIYAITIGLTAVASWTNAVEASDVASREASEIAALYRDVSGYPQPARDALVQGVRVYLTNVIEVSWPMQRRGEIPHGGTDLLTDLQVKLYAFEPATDGQRALHAEALGAFNRLTQTRRERLADVGSSVPGTLWTVVLVGAVVAIGATYVFTLDSIQVHAVMTMLLAAMIGLLVFFIAVTDTPYRGRDGISSAPYELVRRDLVGMPVR